MEGGGVLIYLHVRVVQSHHTSALALKRPTSLCVSILIPCPPHQLTPLRLRPPCKTACHTLLMFPKSTMQTICQVVSQGTKSSFFWGGKKGCANGV